MATATTSAAPDNDTDAHFQAWGSWISAQLSAFGWVQTADTGQVNWSTVTHPTVANTAQGYEIWKMADTLQSTKPVFLKIEYGSASAATATAIWVTLGQATDGAGNLSGITTTRKQVISSSASTTLSTCIASGDTNRFQLAMFTNAASGTGFMISIERTKDSSGADTGAGVTIAGCGYTAASFQQTLPLGAGSPPAMENGVISAGTSSGSAVYGANVGIGVIWPFLGQYLNPLLDLLTYISGDSTAGSTMSVPIYGSSHTYYALGSGSLDFQGGQKGNAANTSFLLRYE